MATRPISEKKTPQTVVTEDLFGNRLGIPAEVQKELDEKGLVARWLNAAKLAENQGFHKKGWRVYRSENYKGMDGFLFGSAPDGTVRRGDLVLGAKSKDEVRQHKAFLKNAADRVMGSHKQKAAQELKSMLKQNNSNGSVLDGYEDNE
jgi:hypothetical protein